MQITLHLNAFVLVKSKHSPFILPDSFLKYDMLTLNCFDRFQNCPKMSQKFPFFILNQTMRVNSVIIIFTKIRVNHGRLSHDTLPRYAVLCIVGHLLKDNLVIMRIINEAISLVPLGNHCGKLANKITQPF